MTHHQQNLLAFAHVLQREAPRQQPVPAQKCDVPLRDNQARFSATGLATNLLPFSWVFFAYQWHAYPIQAIPNSMRSISPRGSRIEHTYSNPSPHQIRDLTCRAGDGYQDTCPPEVASFLGLDKYPRTDHIAIHRRYQGWHPRQHDDLLRIDHMPFLTLAEVIIQHANIILTPMHPFHTE